MELKELLQSSKGKFFTVVFTKKNGDDRTMNCRLGVTKHLKGGVNKNTNPDHLTVFDVVNKGYRTVNIETIKTLLLGGEKYSVRGANVYKLVGTK